jgi:hypothetical protein
MPKGKRNQRRSDEKETVLYGPRCAHMRMQHPPTDQCTVRAVVFVLSSDRSDVALTCTCIRIAPIGCRAFGSS